MEYKICSFFGHRKIEITTELKKELKYKIQQLVENNFVDFYFGGLGEFDELCYNIVSEIKNDNQNLRRVFCISDKRWLRESKRPEWLNKENYEEIIYLEPSFDYWYQQIYYRNCAMIDKSDYVIFYVRNTENSGAYKAMKYAIKTKKEYINIIKEK